eukprot:364487-Chlamydomonas_euryale.AAC.12
MQSSRAPRMLTCATANRRGLLRWASQCAMTTAAPAPDWLRYAAGKHMCTFKGDMCAIQEAMRAVTRESV